MGLAKLQAVRPRSNPATKSNRAPKLPLPFLAKTTPRLRLSEGVGSARQSFDDATFLTAMVI